MAVHIIQTRTKTTIHYSLICSKNPKTEPVKYFNIQSSFTVQNPRTQLVKIELVILLYLTSANSDSALLAITHKNRALLTMADIFVNVFSL